MNIGKYIGHFLMKHLAGNRNPEVIRGKKHIACIGDSITFGHGVRGKKEDTWEYMLNELIGDEFQVINYGTSGRTLLSTGDYPYVKDRMYERTLELKAEIYVIMFGTNDSKPYNWNKERFEKEYEEFVLRYRDTLNWPEVIVMTPPHCFPDKSGKTAFDIDPEVLDKDIVPFVRKTALKHHLKLIDLYELTEGHPEWFLDGVHPNKEGNIKIAEYIAEHLKGSEYAA